MRLYYFEKLEVWKNAKTFGVSIYKITEGFPSHEQYGITSQIRRAALSISANIAEGMSRKTPNEKLRFLNIAYSSAIEVLNFLIIAEELEMVATDDYKDLRNAIEKITNQLSALSKKIAV